METTIIALAIALAAMVVISVFAVAYCYKLKEKYSQLLEKLIAEHNKRLDLIDNYDILCAELDKSRDDINKKGEFIENLERDIAKKDEEITHLNECISEYKTEILQYKNQIDELQKDNTLLGQQLSECQVPSEYKLVFNVGDEVELIEDFTTWADNVLVAGSRGTVLEHGRNDKIITAVKFDDDWHFIDNYKLKHAEPSKPICEPVIEVSDPKEDYIAKQKQWVKENGVKNGTPVKLKQYFKHGEDGFCYDWRPNMLNNIGETGKVVNVKKDYIYVRFKSNDGYWCIPYFCLEINRRKR